MTIRASLPLLLLAAAVVPACAGGTPAATPARAPVRAAAEALAPVITDIKDISVDWDAHADAHAGGPRAAPISLTASDGSGLRAVAFEARAVVEGPLAFTE